MRDDPPLYDTLTADSFLEYAFLRWVLTPLVEPATMRYITPQRPVTIGDHTYRIDYALEGSRCYIAVELDGYAYHGSPDAFTYDRLRQNDLQSVGWLVVRFSYDAIRRQTARCVAQLRDTLRLDPVLGALVVPEPVITTPEMDPDPIFGLAPPPRKGKIFMSDTYFATIRDKISLKTLRDCQTQAFGALVTYYGEGGTTAACVMSVGAGKTALGVAACLGVARRRALIVTPGSVIRGTFDRALDHNGSANVLYNLPGGPLIPGSKPPRTITLDRDDGPISAVTRAALLDADIIVTNFHSLGTGDAPDDLLAKLEPGDIDFIVVDEAHIAAAESYQRAFNHFGAARRLLMSACFQRLDGKPIDADVVYRYRLIDSIADGNVKNLRVHRFVPKGKETTYEIVHPDGGRTEIVGRDALLAIVEDEGKVSRIVARSDASIRQVMRATKDALDRQADLLYPIKPRVLFSAMGERHAQQIARIAEEYGIPCDYIHHSMTDVKIRAIRERFEQPSGDLQGIVQLKMLGQGYDFPPITVVVPMRPYGSFSEFYQFVGRGIRILTHPALQGRAGPGEQFLDVIYHAELGLDDHVDTIYRENDMDPPAVPPDAVDEGHMKGDDEEDVPGTVGAMSAGRLEAFVLVERGAIERRVVHDEKRVEQRKRERQREAFAQQYATYAQRTPTPVPFEQFLEIMSVLGD